jgi:hypothetical protein
MNLSLILSFSLYKHVEILQPHSACENYVLVTIMTAKKKKKKRAKVPSPLVLALGHSSEETPQL